MKAKFEMCLFLLLMMVALRLPAQQKDADQKLFEDTKAKAESGNASAQLVLAEDYCFGTHGVTVDYSEAVKWFRKAADQGLAEAQYNLGFCYYHGQGVTQDYVEAVRWYRKAADQDNTVSEFVLGGCFHDGQGVQINYPEAVKWFRKAAERGSTDAQYNLASCYFIGQGVDKNYKMAFFWYRKAAEQGDAGAQNNLGIGYRDGLGVPQDYVNAVQWFRKAAEQGSAGAQYNLGNCYFLGQGVDKNYVEALYWYQKAAEQGVAGAQSNLGVCYENGDGVAQDYGEAIRWFRSAAEQGDSGAQYHLGGCYYNGHGVTKDYAEAVKWYRKAAEQGFSKAQYNIGICYRLGQGVTQNDVEAFKWCLQAAEQGQSDAQYDTGAAYSNGDGVPRNYVEAYKWENLAAAQGSEFAKKYLTIIEMRMTPEQVAEAQRLAAAFVPGEEMPDSNSNNSVSTGNPIATGTGFFITDDGYLISNYHVVKDAAKVRLLTRAGLIGATLVKVDVPNDLALLKVPGQFLPLPVAASRGVRLGGTVATVGFPDIGLQGFSPKLAKGEIASLSGATDDPRYFQISVPVQPGNSGGALVDERGNVVGIVAAKLDAKTALDSTGALPENVNYAVKSSLLLSFLESVPDVDAKLKDPNTKEEPFEDVVKSAQDAAVLVLVY